MTFNPPRLETRCCGDMDPMIEKRTRRGLAALNPRKVVISCRNCGDVIAELCDVTPPPKEVHRTRSGKQVPSSWRMIDGGLLDEETSEFDESS